MPLGCTKGNTSHLRTPSQKDRGTGALIILPISVFFSLFVLVSISSTKHKSVRVMRLTLSLNSRPKS